MLEGIYLNAERGFSKMPKGDLPLLSETTTETTTDLKPLSCKQDDVAHAERGFSKMPKGDLPLLSETTTETTTDLKPLSCKQDDVAKDNVERSLIDYLNQLSGRNYRPAPSNIKLLRARLAEGYTAQEIADVIARKCAEWIDDPKMAQFLRPATVFWR